MAVITAAEAQQIIQQEQHQLNAGRALPPTLGRIQQLMREEVFPICNVGPWEHRLERQALQLFVPAYDKTQDSDGIGYAASDPMPCIRREAKIINEDEFGYIDDDGRAVAMDLLGYGFGMPPHNDRRKFGLFIPAGKLPAKDEIEAATRRLFDHYRDLVQEARDAFSRGADEWKNTRSERHLLAARALGVNEQWVGQTAEEGSVRCEMCGTFNPRGVAKCHRCGDIIDFELYTRLEARRKDRLSKIKG